MTDSAVKYERGDDGIVVLTLDDPTASANTMNDLYRDSMHAAVDRLYEEREDITGVVVTSAKKTFFAGGNLKGMLAAGPEDAEAVFEMGQDDQVRPAPAGEARQAGRGGDQRGSPRRRPRDHARLPSPDRGRRPQGRARPARGDARTAAGRWRCHPDGADVRHPVRADGRAAAGTALQAGPGAGEGPGRRARRQPRGPDPRRQGVDPGGRRGPGRGHEPVGPRGLQDPRRQPVEPGARGLPAGLPGDAAQADQGRELPGPARHHGGRDRGSTGRLRDRQPDRVALPRRADRRFQQQEHDPGVLLRPPGDQLRPAAPRGRAPVPGHQGGCARRRDDGRRHRLLVRARRHGRRPEGRQPGVRREGQGLQREAADQGRRAREVDGGEEGRGPGPDHRDHRARRPGRLRPRHRGRLRGPLAQGAGLRRDPGRRQRGLTAVLEHLDAPDHRARARREPPRRLRRPALLLARRQDAAGGDHPRGADLRRVGGTRARRGDADPQDPDRGQRQPRLLHQPRDRHDGQRGPGDAR